MDKVKIDGIFDRVIMLLGKKDVFGATDHFLNLITPTPDLSARRDGISDAFANAINNNSVSKKMMVDLLLKYDRGVATIYTEKQ